jgi:hypothetical protein
MCTGEARVFNPKERMAEGMGWIASLSSQTYTWGIEAPLLHPDRTRTNSFFSLQTNTGRHRWRREAEKWAGV